MANNTKSGIDPFASIKTIKKDFEDNKYTPREYLESCVERFGKLDKNLGSALEVFDVDSIVSASSQTGSLAGIPGLVKDNICQKGRIASCGSKMLENYVAPYDATVSSRVKKAGAFLLGRGNCDEFAMGSSNETSAFQKTANPWDLSRVPGGSSGGPAAAVAAGLVPWGFGTETGGSVRQPAAFCGIVGIKPTYGLVSRYGVVAYGSSLDQVGVFSRTVYDNALVFSSIAGHDKRDSTSAQNVQSIDYTQDLSGKIPAGLTIGVIDNALEAEGIDPQIRVLLDDALAVYEKLGAKIKRISLPTMDYGAAVYFMLSRAEAASNLARFDGVRYGFRAPDVENLTELYEKTRGLGFGQEVKRRILIGNYVLSAGHADEYCESAKKVRGMMRQEFVDAFKDVDVLFAPVTPMTAFKFGAFDDNRLQMDLQDYFTAPVNLVGVPAIAVPCGFTQENLPTAFQLIGADFSEKLLYQVAHAYEQATPWHTMRPESFK